MRRLDSHEAARKRRFGSSPQMGGTKEGLVAGYHICMFHRVRVSSCQGFQRDTFPVLYSWQSMSEKVGSVPIQVE